MILDLLGIKGNKNTERRLRRLTEERDYDELSRLFRRAGYPLMPSDFEGVRVVDTRSLPTTYGPKLGEVFSGLEQRTLEFPYERWDEVARKLGIEEWSGMAGLVNGVNVISDRAPHEDAHNFFESLRSEPSDPVLRLQYYLIDEIAAWYLDHLTGRRNIPDMNRYRSYYTQQLSCNTILSPKETREYGKLARRVCELVIERDVGIEDFWEKLSDSNVYLRYLHDWLGGYTGPNLTYDEIFPPWVQETIQNNNRMYSQMN